MKYNFRTGFTLVELLIVISILLIVSPIAYHLIGEIRASSDRLDRRMTWVGNADAASRTWREDVSLASSIQLVESKMQITRPVQDGDQLVVYQLLDNGQLIRKIKSENANTKNLRYLAMDVESLEFVPLETGYQMMVNFSFHDGLQTWKHHATSFAAPLTKGEQP